MPHSTAAYLADVIDACDAIAEVLAGVVLTQLAAPGTPVHYGPRLSAVDPRSGVVVSGTPETGVA